MLASDASAALRLHATAYLLSQGQIVQDLLTQRGVTEAAEGFAFSSFKTFQVRVADVAGLTGLDFGPLSAADPLARLGGEEGTMPGAKPIVQIEALAQIVV
jgi:endonuclease G, mitochondrial